MTVNATNKRRELALAVALILFCIAAVPLILESCSKTKAEVATSSTSELLCTAVRVKDYSPSGTSAALVRCEDSRYDVVCYVAVRGSYLWCIEKRQEDIP